MPFPQRPKISDKDKAASDTVTRVSIEEKDNDQRQEATVESVTASQP
jgi:hypothetical protein